MAQGSKNVFTVGVHFCSFPLRVGADLSRRVDLKLLPRVNQAVDHRWCSGAGHLVSAVGLVPVMRCRPRHMQAACVQIYRTESAFDESNMHGAWQAAKQLKTRANISIDSCDGWAGLCKQVNSSITRPEGSREDMALCRRSATTAAEKRPRPSKRNRITRLQAF